MKLENTVRTLDSEVLLQTPLDADSFLRMEDKFFVPRRNMPELLDLLRYYLEPSYPDPSTRFTFIESIYFDSPLLDLYQMHFLNQKSRFKVRIRKYLPNGVAFSVSKGSEALFIEVKIKEAGISSKFRLQIGDRDAEALKTGMFLGMSPDLQARNLKLDQKKLEKRLLILNSKIQEFCLRPLARVSYRRHAFEKNGLRMTVDENIQSVIYHELSSSLKSSHKNNVDLLLKSSQMVEQFSPNDFLVLEVKHQGFLPEWVMSLPNQVHCKKVSFSKYAYSISRRLLDL